jgi:hypothetical protein
MSAAHGMERSGLGGTPSGATNRKTRVIERRRRIEACAKRDVGMVVCKIRAGLAMIEHPSSCSTPIRLPAFNLPH